MSFCTGQRVSLVRKCRYGVHRLFPGVEATAGASCRVRHHVPYGERAIWQSCGATSSRTLQFRAFTAISLQRLSAIWSVIHARAHLEGLFVP